MGYGAANVLKCKTHGLLYVEECSACLQVERDALVARVRELDVHPLEPSMDKLKNLLSRCKCGVFITVNEHRGYYQSARDWFQEHDQYECPPEVEPEVRATMIGTNTVIQIQFYPDTPVGSYSIYHYDLDAALDAALACFN